MTEERRFLLMKRGLYYRPDSNGYTGYKDKAGRFLQSDASPEHEVFAVHEDDAELWSPGCGQEVFREIANARILALSARVAELEGRLAIAVAHLQAAADWTDENMGNPIMAIAARNCARNGLAALTKEAVVDG